MRRIQERSRGNYDQRPHYHEDERWYASGPRDDDRDRYEQDRERSSRWQDERYDEHRFNQDEDDRAGRKWGGMSSDYEIDETGRFHRDADEEEDDRIRSGRYNTRSPNYDDRPRSFGPMRGMRGERDQFGRFTGDERFGGWHHQRRGVHWQDRPGYEPPRYRDDRPYEGRRRYEDDRYFQQRQYRDDDRRFFDRRDVRDDYDRRRDFASSPDDDRRRGMWSRR